MNSEKSIRAAYDEIKQRELTELENAVRNEGGGVAFSEYYAPVIMCNFNGYYPHPADVRITRVELLDEEDEEVLRIYGQEKGQSGCSDWYEDEREINITDIAYGQLSYITQSIKPKKVFNISVETRNFSETVAEISYALYGKIYDKLEDSFATQAEIIHLAIQFEREHDWLYEDFLDEMEKFTRQQLQKYESNES
jgi:hypothetical protein